MPVRFNFARRKAAEVLEKRRILRPPVPVEDVAKALGATVLYEPFDGQMSGMIHRRPDGTVVVGINANHAATRQRFSIAHELGHLVLHQSEEFHIDERFPFDFRDERASQGTDEREIEANQFAAELLMPHEMLKVAIRKLPPTTDGDDAVDLLAEQFGVSAKAMAIRLSALKILTV